MKKVGSAIYWKRSGARSTKQAHLVGCSPEAKCVRARQRRPN
jgi:hypothetical protein